MTTETKINTRSKNLFTAHPASVGETYFQHMQSAAGFGATMLRAASMCLVHALLPFVFKTSASQAITELHDRMVKNRARQNT